MLNLAWPWMLLALPLPLLVRWLLPRLKYHGPALRSPFMVRFAQADQETPAPGAPRLPMVLLVILWLALTLAAARPQWLGEAMAVAASGRDLMLAVDISESMQIADMVVEGEAQPRLIAVKEVVGDFVDRRRGDRLGLILFGSQAYLQTPLTFDRATLDKLLQEARIGFAGKATAIGDAIGLAVKHLRHRPAQSRVLILLSDGADTASQLPPRRAAELAARYGVRIYTVGIGAEVVERRSFFGTRRFNPSADLDETMLRAIADATGGRYFRARDPGELASIYETLDELEPVAQEEETVRPTRSLFHWPLAAALAAYMGLILLRVKRNGDG